MPAPATSEPEDVRLGRAARLALQEAEARWRRELGAAANERNRLREEIRNLKGVPAPSDASSSEPAAKRQRLGPKGPAQPLIGRTELYAKYHTVEEQLRAEKSKSADLEAQLSRLIDELHTHMPVLKERSVRLEAALASNTSLSERLTLALRESDAAHKAAEKLRVEVDAARAAIEETCAGDAEKRSLLELRQELHREQLSTEARIAEAVAAVREPLSAQASAAEARATAATAQQDVLEAALATVRQTSDRWRVLYEASLGVAAADASSASASSASSATQAAQAAQALAEVRALLAEGVEGQVRMQLSSAQAQMQERISALEAELAQARASATSASEAAAAAAATAAAATAAAAAAAAAPSKAEGAMVPAASLKALEASLKEKEDQLGKLRNAAKHWKDQFEKLKADGGAKPDGAEDLQQRLAALEAELRAQYGADALQQRLAELEAQVRAATEAKAAATEQLAAAVAESAALRERLEVATAEAARNDAAGDGMASSITAGGAASAGRVSEAAAAAAAEIGEVKARLAAATSEAEALRGKLAAAEEAADKMRKAASHWKAQHGKLKEQLDAAAAAPATATPEPAPPAANSQPAPPAANSQPAPPAANSSEGSAVGLTTELEAAKIRISEIEIELQAALEAKVMAVSEAEGRAAEAESNAAQLEVRVMEAEAKVAEAEAKVAEAEAKAAEAETKAAEADAKGTQVGSGSTTEEAEALRGKLAAAEEAADKMRKAASHWKAQHGKLKEQLDAALAAAPAPEEVAPSAGVT
eukprot:jgi/Chrpa1/6058/Chrysochromulina_OHIO_Genome00001742-RA